MPAMTADQAREYLALQQYPMMVGLGKSYLNRYADKELRRLKLEKLAEKHSQAFVKEVRIFIWRAWLEKQYQKEQAV